MPDPKVPSEREPRLIARSDKPRSNPSNNPFDSMDAKSRSCPNPSSAAAFAPSESTASIPDSERSTPPLAEGPAGIRPFSRRPSFFISRKSFCSRSSAHNRTPQLMSNPTPPGEITPPFSTSVATTPPIGKPKPKWKSAMAQALPTIPGIAAVFAN